MTSATEHVDRKAQDARGEQPLNIAAHLPRMASTVPDQPAVVVTVRRGAGGRAVYATKSFAEMEALSNRYANALTSIGVERGMRTLLMVRPGFDFIALTYALFKIGAVPVMIDPGMGVGRMLKCIAQVDVQAFVGVPMAHAMRVLRPRPFRSVRHVLTVGRRWFWGGPTLATQAGKAVDTFEPAKTAGDEVAAILFTSGSTGPAKGVVYEHGMFDAQVRAIQAQYDMQPGEVDLPAFPLFALFSMAMGMTSVIPDMDPSKPAQVNPARIVQAILDQHVTTSFGSPALWKRVAAYCVERKIRLPSLRRILIAGAPVPYPVIEQLHRVLPDDADVHTPYGATESLPICSIAGREVLRDCRDKTRGGAGTCVGRPLQDCEVRIIRITDEPLSEWSSDLLVADREIGEIVVRGPIVTKTYFGLPEATAHAKIREGTTFWHRIGDVGYRDADGRIWFCGRKAHRVQTKDGLLFSVRCEAIFNEHPDVARCALVGVQASDGATPVVVVEPVSGKFPRGAAVLRFWEELLELGRANKMTQSIELFLFHPSLPVDVRHNTKIDREALAAWATEELA